MTLAAMNEVNCFMVTSPLSILQTGGLIPSSHTFNTQLYRSMVQGKTGIPSSRVTVLRQPCVRSDPMSLQAWLKRLAFSLFIIAFALFWRGQKQIQAGDQSAGSYLWIVGAVVCVVLGSIGLRLRHQSPRP